MKLKEKQKQMKQAATEFANGSPIELVMQKYNVCYASVYNALKKFNIPYAYPGNRKTAFDINFFHKIDTEDKAYWLGFIFADGCVLQTCEDVSGPNRLRIALSQKDIDHLYKFCDAIGHSHDAVHSYLRPADSFIKEDHWISCVNCDSVVMARDLISHNCFPQKTYVPSFPDDVPEHLMRHFIRGYFDGDGCISGTTAGQFEITTEKVAVERMQSILMEACHLGRTKLRFCRNAYTLRYGGCRQLKRIYDYLYHDAHVFLDRKYDKFRSYVFT